jgi:hypothetical protein
METSPTAISIPGTPNVIAAPVQSMWQTDTVSLRLVMGQLGFATFERTRLADGHGVVTR